MDRLDEPHPPKIGIDSLSGGFALARAAEAQQDPLKKTKLFEGVVRELSTHIASHPNDSNVHLIRMQLAHALLALGKEAEALHELDATLKLGERVKEHREAIITACLDLVLKMDAKTTYPPVPPLGEVPSPIALPDLKKRLAAYAAAYLALSPQSDQKLPLDFQVTQDLFVYGHYDQAMQRFEQLVSEFPASEQAKIAIEVLLSMNLKRQKWDELVRLSTAFLNNRDIKGKALRDYMRENLEYGRQNLLAH